MRSMTCPSQSPNRRRAAMSVETVRGAEGSGPLEFVVALDRAISTTVTVDYRTVGMTAINESPRNRGGLHRYERDAHVCPGRDAQDCPGDPRGQYPERGRGITSSLSGEPDKRGAAATDTDDAYGAGHRRGRRSVAGHIGRGNDGDSWSYGDEAGGPLSYTVVLSEVSSRVVMVDYATVDRSPGTRGPGLTTATAIEDYAPLSGMLTFLPGETEKSLTVILNDDKLSEDDEVFALQLSNPPKCGAGQRGLGLNSGRG